MKVPKGWKATTYERRVNGCWIIVERVKVDQWSWWTGGDLFDESGRAKTAAVAMRAAERAARKGKR